MQPPCDLEVHVNDGQMYYLRKGTLLSRCGLLVKTLINATSPTGDQAQLLVHSYQRVVLNDLPGGAQAFELVARFCYSGGNLAITKTNVAMLRCAAEFLEMTEEYVQDNLIQQTEVFLSNIAFWSLKECMTLLRTCEMLVPLAENTRIIQRCVDSLAAKFSSCSSDSTPVCFSPASPSSSDTKSSEGYSRACLYDNMTFLSTYMLDKVVKALLANNVDNRFLAKFLLHYLLASVPIPGHRCVCPTRKPDTEKKFSDRHTQKAQRDVLETVVSLLHSFEWSSVSCKSLFGVRRLATTLNASKHSRKQLEEMIGSQLDKATLDNILITSGPHRSGCFYDVDLILRLVQKFLQIQACPAALENLRVVRSCSSKNASLRTVGNLLDMYLAEIAPDPSLSAAKFQALTESLPDDARASHDELYRALDIYLEAHPRTTEDEAMEICKVVNFQKLSFEASKHVAQNLRFPARLTLRVLLQQQANLKAAIDGSIVKRDSSHRYGSRNFMANSSSHQHIMEYPEELDYHSVLRQNEQLRSELQKMQSRVVELEKECSRMRSRVSKHLRIKHLLC